mgnify:CR=1 FL=1
MLKKYSYPWQALTWVWAAPARSPAWWLSDKPDWTATLGSSPALPCGCDGPTPLATWYDNWTASWGSTPALSKRRAETWGCVWTGASWGCCAAVSIAVTSTSWFLSWRALSALTSEEEMLERLALECVRLVVPSCDKASFTLHELRCLLKPTRFLHNFLQNPHGTY